MPKLIQGILQSKQHNLLFFPGSGGCGKSLKTSFNAVSRVSLYRSAYPSKPSVLLLETTDVATININGNTCRFSYTLKLKHCGNIFNDANKPELRNNYSGVEL